jgi:hypothetical protein
MVDFPTGATHVIDLDRQFRGRPWSITPRPWKPGDVALHERFGPVVLISPVPKWETLWQCLIVNGGGAVARNDRLDANNLIGISRGVWVEQVRLATGGQP